MKKQTNHYVSNDDFIIALTERRAILAKLAPDEEKPVISDYIAKCIFDICNKLSYRPNFIGYSFRQEMVGDALENCLRVVDNYDPEISKYAFAYFTQIAWYAFVRRIGTEQKQSYIKAKIIESMPINELINTEDGEIGAVTEDMRQQYYFDTKGYEAAKAAKKKVIKDSLEEFMEEK